MSFKNLLRKAFVPLTILNKCIPKDPKLVFFYSNLGFRDNVKAMFDYLIAHGYQQKYRIVCATNEAGRFQRIAAEYPEQYKNVKFVSCRAGVWPFLRCKVGFYCFGKYPIKPAGNQTIINLWHGMPLKRIGNMEEALKDVDYNYFTYLLATSEFYGDIMKKCFSCGDDQILIEGQPRNDAFFTPWSSSQKKLKEQYEKVLVWLPTYREGESEGALDNTYVLPLVHGEDLERLNDHLREKESLLIVKFHPLQRHRGLPSFSHIEFLDQSAMEKKYGNLYQMLKVSDGLITDYSSIFFDYLLLNRPMAFTVNDLKEYENSRGFVFDNPGEYMAGKKIQSYEQLREFVVEVLDGVDSYRTERERVNQLINRYKDGHSSERIAKRYLSDL